MIVLMLIPAWRWPESGWTGGEKLAEWFATKAADQPEPLDDHDPRAPSQPQRDPAAASPPDPAPVSRWCGGRPHRRVQFAGPRDRRSARENNAGKRTRRAQRTLLSFLRDRAAG